MGLRDNKRRAGHPAYALHDNDGIFVEHDRGSRRQPTMETAWQLRCAAALKLFATSEPLGRPHNGALDHPEKRKPPGRIELPTCRLQGGCSTD